MIKLIIPLIILLIIFFILIIYLFISNNRKFYELEKIIKETNNIVQESDSNEKKDDNSLKNNNDLKNEISKLDKRVVFFENNINQASSDLVFNNIVKDGTYGSHSELGFEVSKSGQEVQINKDLILEKNLKMPVWDYMVAIFHDE